MRRIEEILERPYREDGAYRVPEGYFNTLNKRIMDAIPEERHVQKKTRFTFLSRTKYAAAACITGLLMVTGTLAFYFNGSGNKTELAESEAQQETITDEYMKECMDYAMVDNNDVLLYLA